jgi:hypothetical protein
MSRQVKIVFANEYYEEDAGSRMHVDASITDWETVTDEEYTFLRDNWWKLFPSKSRYGQDKEVYILITKDEETIPARLVELRDLLKEQIAKDKARQEKEKAALAAKEAKKLEKKKKLLEELKKEFGDE